MLLESKDDSCSDHSVHLSSINFISVHDMSWPNLCKSSITILEPVFLCMLSGSKNWLNDGVVFGINESMPEQIFLTFVALPLRELHTTVYIKWWIWIRAIKLQRQTFPFSSLLPIISWGTEGQSFRLSLLLCWMPKLIDLAIFFSATDNCILSPAAFIQSIISSSLDESTYSKSLKMYCMMISQNLNCSQTLLQVFPLSLSFSVWCL